MRLKGKEYDKRLAEYSYDTLLLISECMNVREKCWIEAST